MKTVLKIVGVLGVSLVMSDMICVRFRRHQFMSELDSILSPAKPVLGAIRKYMPRFESGFRVQIQTNKRPSSGSRSSMDMSQQPRWWAPHVASSAFGP